MNIGKALAISAVTGILVSVSGCGGASDTGTTAKSPSTDTSAPAAKDCCKGKNACKGTSGCKTDTNAACAGKNSCKGQGTSCPKPAG